MLVFNAFQKLKMLKFRGKKIYKLGYLFLVGILGIAVGELWCENFDFDTQFAFYDLFEYFGQRAYE